MNIEFLKDNYKTIDSSLRESLSLFHEIRSFLKEKLTLDREYSAKVESLVEKYQNKYENKRNIMSTSSPLLPQIVSQSWCVAWNAFLMEYHQFYKAMNEDAEEEMHVFHDLFKAFEKREDEARIKNENFYHQLLNDYDIMMHENEKNRSKYVEGYFSLMRLDSFTTMQTTSDKSDKKAKDLKVEINNRKIECLLSIESLNDRSHRLHERELPQLFDWIEEQGVFRIQRLKSFFNTFLSRESKLISSLSSHIEAIKNGINEIEPERDARSDLEKPRAVLKEACKPAIIQFMNDAHKSDDTFFPSDELSTSYLINKYIKLKEKCQFVQADINAKNKEIANIVALKESYMKDPKLGDYLNVLDAEMDFRKQLSLLEGVTMMLLTQLNKIESVLGRERLSSLQSHSLKKASFAIATNCAASSSNPCSSYKGTISSCIDCGYACHAKCQWRVMHNCTHSKAKTVKFLSSKHAASAGSATAENPSNGSSIWSMDLGTLGVVNTKEPNHQGPGSDTSPTMEKGDASQLSSAASSVDSVESSAIVPKYITEPLKSLTCKKKPDVEKQPEGDTKVVDMAATVLYDYAPQDTDELEVKKSQQVTIVSVPDAGWIKVADEKNEEGFVPMSYLKLVRNKNATIEKSDMLKGLVSLNVLYGYEAQDEDELSLKVGESIRLIAKSDDGWWLGEKDGKRGLFPANYVTVYSPPHP